jgi:hypothetical protein
VKNILEKIKKIFRKRILIGAGYVDMSWRMNLQKKPWK